MVCILARLAFFAVFMQCGNFRAPPQDSSSDTHIQAPASNGGSGNTRVNETRARKNACCKVWTAHLVANLDEGPHFGLPAVLASHTTNRERERERERNDEGVGGVTAKLKWRLAGVATVVSRQPPLKDRDIELTPYPGLL
jgi:hypothetical protein